jgi:dihydrofolate reductase
MRKITVISMITLDGVIQGPGGPEEDRSGGFEYGGWVAPYSDDVFNENMAKDMQPADYLLGRKTFDIWENYWPEHGDIWPAINEGTKYVFSNTRDKSDWKSTEFITSVADIEKIKNSEGKDIHVWGSGKLIQLLFKHDLVDELRLKIYPITLGQGKNLFEDGPIPAAFKLTESIATPSGVIIANYTRDGEVKTGNVAV